MKTVKASEVIISEPVALSELKLFLKIDHDADDETLDRTRKAARQWVEAYTSKNWAQKRVTYNVLGDGSNRVKVEGNGFYSLEFEGQAIPPTDTIVFDGVEVVFGSEKDKVYQLTVNDGKETPPEAITEAIKKMASLYYFERETQGVGTQDIKTLLLPFRNFLFI